MFLYNIHNKNNLMAQILGSLYFREYIINESHNIFIIIMYLIKVKYYIIKNHTEF